MTEERNKFENYINAKLNEHLEALEKLREKQFVQLESKFEASRQSEKLIQSRKEKEKREIDLIFDEYLDWVQETMSTEDNPYIQVIAVLRGIN